MVEQLERNLCHLAQIINQQLGTDIQALPAAGAAGGLAGGLAGFFGAKLQSGSELIIQALDLERRIARAQLCITGEGRLDDQTLGGKTVYSVAKLANKYGIATIAIVGAASPTASRTIPPLTAYFSIVDQPMKLEQALQQAEQLVANTAEQVMRLLKLS